MVQVKSLETVKKKWGEVTPQRAPYYEEGIKTPRRSWSAQASAAQPAYEAAMRDAAVLKLRETNIKKAGDEKWQRKAIAVGASRFREGVPVATDDYGKGIEPYLSAMASLALPERGARGDPKNYARTKAIGDALHKKRMGTG